ncbi:acetylxylan esterase [Neobacillus dielmonensis]|uniref:acetylxylan esterase n=1 Tax=Neobacillus dielmonensis TaxID=1347369 RepID=UPI000693ACD6|nr:alpha/beta fold hydrolase [Neobacillus dielmonensis]
MYSIETLIKTIKTYKPEMTKEEDFESFWTSTLEESAQVPLQPILIEIDYPIEQIRAFHVTYQGFGGTLIKGYYMVPKERNQELPCIITFHGYGGNKSSVSNYLKWLIQGIAVFAVDCRGHGESGDDSLYSSGSAGTWATQGLLDKNEYYYRKVYMDSKRAIDFVFTRPEIDHHRVCLLGASMGGGIALAVAALDQRPKLVVADVPNMCNLELAIQQKFEGSLVKIEEYLSRFPEKSAQVFQTLSYFDNLNLASKITSKVRLTAALKDLICPPQTIYGVYNHIHSDKSIIAYPFSGHDAPGISSHIDATIQFIKEHL